ncbi:hypothetical protein C0Q70_10289 [Pomacea canaliculata]|uniref:Uncharacterized protein n=1 Tax=Pomacea canaliculata TaxID=400727 RepID=A0A2T7PC60_POMCA|nr:hypothetical protein C0Q70_10289 [Pomacea canaliculata]
MQAEYPPSFTMEGTLAAFPKHSLSESYCYQSDIPRRLQRCERSSEIVTNKSNQIECFIR